MHEEEKKAKQTNKQIKQSSNSLQMQTGRWAIR